MEKLERSRWAAVAGALLATAAVGWIGTARGAPSSEEITLQARITDPGGQPITNTLTLHFRLVDEKGVGVGTPAWSETLTDVSVVNGILSVVLGSQNPLTPSLDLAGGERFIEIWLGSDTSGQRLGAVKVTAAAYAVAAGSAERIWNPATGTADDIAALDSRYVLASGGGADVVRTVNDRDLGLRCVGERDRQLPVDRSRW